MLYLVGIGDSTLGNLTQNALEAIDKSEIIIGYKKYIDDLEKIFPKKTYIRGHMTKEISRCKKALDLSKDKVVSLVSSGDSGIYAMAGLVLELNKEELDVEIIPGITSAVIAASLLGAPLMNDFVCISFSDLLTPMSVIEKRIIKSCEGDFVMVIYNPSSKKRQRKYYHFINLISSYKKGHTPVGILKNLGSISEEKIITTLNKVLRHDVDMNTIIIIGNSMTYNISNKLVTKRGYF